MGDRITLKPVARRPHIRCTIFFGSSNVIAAGWVGGGGCQMHAEKRLTALFFQRHQDITNSPTNRESRIAAERWRSKAVVFSKFPVDRLSLSPVDPRSQLRKETGTTARLDLRSFRFLDTINLTTGS